MSNAVAHAFNVYVVDKNEQPLPGARVSWVVKHNGKRKTLGPVTTLGAANSPAHVNISSGIEGDYITIIARYGTKAPKKITVKKDSPNQTIKFNFVGPSAPPKNKSLSIQIVIHYIIALALIALGIYFISNHVTTDAIDVELLDSKLKTSSIGVFTIFIGIVLMLHSLQITVRAVMFNKKDENGA